MKLTGMKIKKAKPEAKTRKLFDGGGLYLQVEPTGGKLWRFKYRFEEKHKLLALGKYPDVPLQEARKCHQEAREQLAKGIDPSAAKKATAAAKRGLTENSFEIVAREWFANWKLDKSDSHIEKNPKTPRIRTRSLSLGLYPVAELKAPDVLSVCRRLESRGAVEMAHRVKVTISQVMRYAIATSRAERDPCPDLRGALKPVQPQPLQASQTQRKWRGC